MILLVLEKGLARVLTYLVQGDEGRTSCHVCRLGPGVYSPTGICFNDALLDGGFLGRGVA